MARPGRRNAGWFKRGHDPRRHEFTWDECSRGGRASFAYLMEYKPEVLLGLRKKLRGTRSHKGGWHGEEGAR
jgi:hypothetical protein